MSQAGANTPANHFGGSFGPNEWLVQEMYERYQSDPSSVDKSWWEFFADYKGTPSLNNSVKSGTPPIPKSQLAKPVPPAPVAKSEVITPEVIKPVIEKNVTPVKTSTTTIKPADPVVKPIPTLATPGAATVEPLRGVAARVVQSMEGSLSVPTATSVRVVPAKLMIDNRTVINNHLKRGRGGKVSFTHLIGYAMVKAIRSMPEMNTFFTDLDGKPAIGHPEHINLGIAIDLAKADGSRQLLVPSIKGCEGLDFAQFWSAYEDIVRKARAGSLTVEDFAGTTISLTNPGTIGTVHSVPRLVQGQGLILGVGSLDYPAEFHGANEQALADLAISKVVTITSTYDHRIIQGAQSGEFLRRIHEILLGEENFYDEIFEALRIPYVPIRWVVDIQFDKDDDVSKTARVQKLIDAYRTTGHLMADVEPLSYVQRSHPDLDVVSHGLSLWDLDREFATGGFGGKSFMKLRRILGVLRDSYCRTIGVEYMYIANPDERKWMQERMEVGAPRTPRDEQLRILRKLNSAEAFETFLQTKYVGQKRFSLEGGESVIPVLDAMISAAADAGLDEVCVGMPHRGRLNILANIAGKSYGQIFQEFEGNYHDNEVHGSGDVKYHLGTKGTFVSESGAKTKIYLAANPSHLEAVNPVLEGIVRAKQDKLRVAAGDTTIDEQTTYPVMPILLHGDAAFAGQGVVSETLSLSLLKGYRTGGTIHIIVNNQVGFTTSPSAARSSTYSTDIAKMIQSPVFHVNGDDPEACVRVARIAFEYRQTFNKDVVIDMICYRRRGHNEGDEPSFTQPLMYKLIDAKRSTRKLYTEALIGRGDITVEEAEEVLRDYQQQLEGVFTSVHNTEPESDPSWRPPVVPAPATVNTSVAEDQLRKIALTQSSMPVEFTVHPKLLPQLLKRVEMLDESTVDWATGEMFAFGSLLLDGHPIRMSGQDVRRGTFSNRHAVIIDKENGKELFPLRSLVKDPNQFHIYDSLLSEYAVMGFEYGYSVERDNALVVWEAQFGDFANGAQTVIDEFISSALQKWGERSSVVLLLPHGYEGQGPDHSSGRIERFLALCAEQNMTVAQPSTPASYFHLLRWHMKNPARRPLIVFEPKSMLRLKAAASGLKDFTTGTFKPFIPDDKVVNTTRLIFTSGKVYYDLIAEREKLGEHSTAIARVEQLYPLPIEEMIAEAKKHPKATLLWVQDEPANQGPWPYIALTASEAFVAHEELSGRSIRRVSRRATASPATGNHHLHEEEEKALMTEAFTR
ncbi:2-oxoglutarate dehydrogenase E1 component [Candidatus Nanopelagicus abundans]|uniref:2-oxoglutarate dehydrogenase E1 component n=1 Tax=Candidatus Nanopelagicus abundans TaxID=1884916 RepID=A0A249L553_9ACTN|nr:multifunctional oxoglutarate decarboxylase/oxoglutarate dehydrogenase thiamine pyrophosphate-binding subunit/dihydrolipoyllysine-residue succinyltransferase subunit [Candidatus Nanopelagicus abundans]ASY24211.1 2-oxoglutarate dehydrogenase E1 component [Candidatus Nanopelagicus abundans]